MSFQVMHPGYISLIYVLFILRERTPMSMVAEFRSFIAKGNVIDLAVGIIIGGDGEIGAAAGEQRCL